MRSIAFRPGQHEKGPDRRVWTVEDVRALGLTTTVETAASVLGIGRTKAYAMAKDGSFPVKLLKVGRRYLVPIPALLNLVAGQ